MMSSTKMIAARDPYGFRPLSDGKMPDGTYVAASESCALSAVGAEFVRDILPREILVISSKRGRIQKVNICGKKKNQRPAFLNIFILPGRTL